MKQLVLVEPELAKKTWEVLGPFIKRAMNRGFPSYETVTNGVLGGHLQAWAVIEDAQIHGAAVTQIFDGDLFMVGAGGNMAECLPFFGAFEDFARAQGCKCLRIIGRKGWARMLPDYKQTAIVLEKRF